jgi:tRNA (mo5U34)-methyltransferase
MDGFWAFELERRGASEVVALDLPGSAGRPRFDAAARALGSRAAYETGSVFDLEPSRHGLFDVVIIGYVLQMVDDPLGALKAARSVCRGAVVIVETVSAPLSLLPTPLARLDARRDGRERFVFNRAGLRTALSIAGFAVESISGVLRDHPGPQVARVGVDRRARLLHAARLRGRSVIVVARPTEPGPAELS